jgi:diguanylate cyclase (GGDEF)-like protein
MIGDLRVSLKPGCRAAALLFLGFLTVLLPVRLLADAPGTLTEVRAVRSLSAEEAGKSRPVHLRGVVTVVSGWKSSFFFQDDAGGSSTGISINRADGSSAVHQGQEVEIRGVTSPGLFAPLVEASDVKVLGEGKLPVPPLVTPDVLLGGKLDSQWIALQGTVRAATIKQSWGRPVLFLDVDAGGGVMVSARIQDFPEHGWQSLPTSTVLIRGVAATNFNDKRQFIGLRLFVASLKDVDLIRRAPDDPFDRPVRVLGGLLRFDPSQEGITPVKVRGVVTYVTPDQGFYLQQGTEGVLVRSTQTTGLKVGMEVEAVGYPGGGEYSPSLESSTYREVKSKPELIEPVSVSASQMIVEKEGFSGSPYDAQLVRMQGTLRQAILGTEDYVLFVQDAGQTYTVRLPKSEGTEGIPPVGSRIQVTGVCYTRVDSGHEARAFRVLLRSIDDIVVLERAPWWSASHAKLVVVALLIIVVLLAIWVWISRREGSLRQLALTDPLTGLYNRRGFVLLAEHQMKAVIRKRASLLLFYIDLNDFKIINDTLGHKQGDVALQAVASALRECFRKADLLARLGGDEFAVSAVDASPSSSGLLEERLDRLIQQWNMKEGTPFQLSLSIGVLVWDDLESGEDFDALLARADALMYKKKRARKSGSQEPVEELTGAGNGTP